MNDTRSPRSRSSLVLPLPPPRALVVLLLLSATPASLLLCASPSIRSVHLESRTVGLYEKIELRIDLDSTFANPFDPEEIDLRAEFTSPSGRLHAIWGFYNPSSWAALWMVRFAPTEVGEWRCRIEVTDREGTARSGVRRFTVVDSSHHGFVGVAPNQRYLKFTDGTSFYGIGLWYNDSYELFGEGRVTERGLDELKEVGANFLSCFLTPLETMASGLGRYDQNRCGRLDQLLGWCEERDLYVSLNLWFHSYLSEAVWGGGNARYRNNPYRLVAPAVDFFGSREAWAYQERLYRYIIARWGYSRALFLWFIIDEINGTEGWQKGEQAVAEAWCGKVQAFFKEHDPYRRPTTGTQSGGMQQWWPGGYRIFDVAAREIYEAQGHPMPESGKPGPGDEHPLQFSYRNYAIQTRKLWDGFEKPAINGECGWDHTYYEPGMPGYLAMYHNALWVSLANGLCATPFWWAYSSRINDSVITRQMLHFARFVEDIDFGNLRPERARIGADNCDAWAMRGSQMVFGWVVNPRTSVANETFTISDLTSGTYEVWLYRTWAGTYLEPQTMATDGGKLSVTIPELRTTRGHASHIGHDVAFKILAK